MIRETHMETTTVGTLLKAKIWPGLLFSTLTDLKRATKQKSSTRTPHMAHAFHEDGGDSFGRKRPGPWLITDDKEEEKQCELAWDWPHAAPRQGPQDHGGEDGRA